MSQSVKENITETWKKINNAVHSSKGHDMLLFMLFLFISFLFWLILTLNNDNQKDIEIPIKLIEIPDSITLINPIPSNISVNVRDKGASLIQYSWGKVPPLNFKFKDYNNRKNHIVINQTELARRLRSYFSPNAQLLSIDPDSISLSYSTSPGKKVGIKLNTDIQPNFQYIISGPVVCNTDSVLLYSAQELPDTIKYVETNSVIKTNLKDTTIVDLKIKPIYGIRIIPDHIRITIPIEPLIAKRQTIPITTTNTPDGADLITFPSEIEVSYLLPMSKYNCTHPQIQATVDYQSITEGYSKIPIQVQYDINEYRNLSFTPDSVEFVVDKQY